MFYLLVFLIVALVSGVLGFGVVPFARTETARICFFVFIVLFLVRLILHLFLTRFDRATRDPESFFPSPPPLTPDEAEPESQADSRLFGFPVRGRLSWFGMASPFAITSCWLKLSGMFDKVRQAAPSAGDFIVMGDPDGYVIERFRPGNGWEHVSIEQHQLLAVSLVQIEESGRPVTMGRWCGSLWIPRR
jgi:uncharacterized membrane protein YtjA (UPF0391 family)